MSRQETAIKIVHFADLHLGVENYGRINPETGLSTRLEDCLKALDRLVDYAIDTAVDLVLFCGDAYKSREPSQTQQREFAKRIARLSAAGIPLFLLVGNHDLPNAAGRATSTEIFDTLAVKNVTVAARPGLHKIATKSGLLQIVALPWPRRSSLLSKEDARSLTFEQVNQRMQEILAGVVSDNAAKIDPAFPAVLAGHIWVAGAKLGSECQMTIGQEHTLLLSNVALPAFDYVALGHIHRRQVLSETPPVVYSGSLERLDFGEEDDDKGFYVVELQGKKPAFYEFHKLSGRRFVTINVNIDSAGLEPTAAVLKAIADGQVKDAIVRVQISSSAENGARLIDGELRNALRDAHYASIAKEIKREARIRLGNFTSDGLTPLDALKVYLDTRKIPEDKAKTLLEYGRRLLEDSETIS